MYLCIDVVLLRNAPQSPLKFVEPVSDHGIPIQLPGFRITIFERAPDDRLFGNLSIVGLSLDGAQSLIAGRSIHFPQVADLW